MKKITRVLSMLAALAMSAATVISLTSNAIAIIVTENEVITKYIIDEDTAKLGFEYYTHITDNGERNGLYSFEFSNDGKIIASPVEIQYNRLSVADEKLDGFLKYMEEKYPDYQLELEYSYTNDSGVNYNQYRITNYDYEILYEEKYQQAIDIRNNTEAGYLSYIYANSVTFNYRYLGDLSSDNALTPVDASMLLSYYADMQSGVAVASAESDVDYSVLGDFNNDGAVTPTDAAEILQYYADQQTGQ